MAALRIHVCFVLAMFFLQGAFAQPGNPFTKSYHVSRKLDYPVFDARDSLVLATNPNLKAEINEEFPPGKYRIESSCKINGKAPLRLCRADLKRDTLTIRILDKSPTINNVLTIKIAGKEFYTLFSFSRPDSESPYHIYPTDQLLLLNKGNFRTGDEVKGYINFRGTGVLKPEDFEDWDSKEDWVPSNYVVRGPFRAVIQ